MQYKIENIETTNVKVVSKDNEFVTKKVILSIEFPLFPIFFKISEKRREKKETRAKYNKESGIIEKSTMVTNLEKAGTARYIKLNGQHIYNRTWHEDIQRRAVAFCQRFFVYSFKQGDINLVKALLNSRHGNLYVECHIHTIENHGGVTENAGKYVIPEAYSPWDIDNLGIFWSKTFDDALQLAQVLPNDDIKIIRGAGGAIYHKVKSITERKLVFKFLVDYA